MIEITVPFPPSDNSHKKLGGFTRSKTGNLVQLRVNTNETKQFFFDVYVLIKQMKATQGVKSFGSAPIYLEVDVYPPDNRKRDITNILKVLNDSLERGGLFDDDYQISRLLIQRCGIVDQGKVVVRIYEVSKCI